MSMEFSRQEYWMEWVAIPFTRYLPDPGLLHCRQILYHLNHRKAPQTVLSVLNSTCLLECITDISN